MEILTFLIILSVFNFWIYVGALVIVDNKTRILKRYTAVPTGLPAIGWAAWELCRWPVTLFESIRERKTVK